MHPDAGDTFGRIYAANEWSGGSGVGSAPDASVVYRQVVSTLISAGDVRSVVDVGCGDWQIGSLIDWGSTRYLGIDVVPELVSQNRQRHPAPHREFRVADARLERLPDGDLLLVKDVLQHWPLADIQAFLTANLHRYRYALVTNDISSLHWPGQVNQDIRLGEWRTLDLERPPFNRTAAWRHDYDVRGEWTKRLVLYASWRARAATRSGGRTALRAVRTVGRSDI